MGNFGASCVPNSTWKHWNSLSPKLTACLHSQNMLASLYRVMRWSKLHAPKAGFRSRYQNASCFGPHFEESSVTSEIGEWETCFQWKWISVQWVFGRNDRDVITNESNKFIELKKWNIFRNHVWKILHIAIVRNTWIQNLRESDLIIRLVQSQPFNRI